MLVYKAELDLLYKDETKLADELSSFFFLMEKTLLKQASEKWKDISFSFQLKEITDCLYGFHEEYINLVTSNVLRFYKHGQDIGERELKKISTKADAEFTSNFGTLPPVEEKLRHNMFIASGTTFDKINLQLNQVIADSYKNGDSYQVMADKIGEKFEQYAGDRALTIARTETHSAHEQGIYDKYGEEGTEFIQWRTGEDNRVRTSHQELSGKIIRYGGTFSNGLKYPGDKDGAIGEWIKCRCHILPFSMPLGYTAPDMAEFTEDMLIPIDAPDIKIPEDVFGISTDAFGNTKIKPTQIFTDLIKNYIGLGPTSIIATKPITAMTRDEKLTLYKELKAKGVNNLGPDELELYYNLDELFNKILIT